MAASIDLHVARPAGSTSARCGPEHTALVVAPAIRLGSGEGLKVAIAPQLTDAPIIVLSVLLVEQLARFGPVLGVVTLLRAAFLIYLAVDAFRVRGVEIAGQNAKPRSVSRGSTSLSASTPESLPTSGS